MTPTVRCSSRTSIEALRPARSSLLPYAALSLLLHLLVLGFPGWRESTAPVDSSPPVRLAARLLPQQPEPAAPPPPVRDTAAPAARPVPKPFPKQTTIPAAPRPQPTPPAAPTIEPAQKTATVSSPEEHLPQDVATPAPPIEPVADTPPPAPQPAPPPTEERLPASGDIRFTVYRGNNNFVVGTATHHWSIDGNRYEIHSVLETAGLAALFRDIRIESESRGRIGPDGLRPQLFSHRRVVKGTSEEAVFDHEAGTIVIGGERQPLPAGAQDLLSIHYQLGGLPSLATGTLVHVTTGRRLEAHRLENLGTEVLTLHSGQRIAALRIRIPGTKTTTEFWLSDDARRLPVKIRHIDRDGESFEQIADAWPTQP